MSSSPTIPYAEITDRVLAACGGGRTLHVGAGVDHDPWVSAFRKRAVPAEGVAYNTGSFVLRAEDRAFDLVCAHGLFDSDDDRTIATTMDELLRVSRGPVWVRASTARAAGSSGQSREAWESVLLARACRKHPLHQMVTPYAGLDYPTGSVDLLFERLPDGLTAGRRLEDLKAARDLHMDMLREAGRRADAHVARYMFASQFIRPGDRILDAACGLGYGSAILCDGTLADYVVGLDIDEAAVRYAHEHYGRTRARLSFGARDVSGIDQLSPASFDAIVSFETLEHLADPERFLAACKRLLTPAGRLICSVPDRWLDETGVDPNPHHLHVFDREKLERACGRHFFVEQVFGQTAGGGMKLPDAGREIWKADAWSDNAEWWLLVGMTDPAGEPAPPLRLGLIEHPEEDHTNVLAFEREYDTPWLVRAMVTIGLRTESPELLELLAERTLTTARAGGADAGAALCVSLYRAIERGDEADSWTLERIAGYCETGNAGPHVRRWQISLRYALGLYHLQRGEFAPARAAFESCAASDALDFSPLLATKTVGAAFLHGWLAAQARDFDTARNAWTHGVNAAERALHRPWNEFLLSRRAPAVFGLREAALVVDLASQCATGLHLLSHAADRPGILAQQLSASLAGRAAAWERRYHAVRAELAGAAQTTPSPSLDSLRSRLGASMLLRDEAPASGVRVAVFGAGSGGRQAIDSLRRRHIDVVCVADNNPARQGDRFEGVPVIAPAELLQQHIDAIAVASIPYRYRIFEQLEALGFTRGRDFDTLEAAPSLPDPVNPRNLSNPTNLIQVSSTGTE